MQDLYGAFVPGTNVVVQPTGQGPLSGLTFASKDLFDVAGFVTGCGNPDWARTHPPARRHAWAVQRLLDAGATLAGKTITDEISLGLLGRNQFDGTPINPKAPDRFPGGSSSGSAAAVAGGLVDFALGTDSGGSVRVPSSFTGIYGIRPTHGAISVEGLMTQAPSFDTAGYFAAGAEIFAKVGAVLLQDAAPAAPITEILFATDAFAACDPVVRDAAAEPTRSIARAVGASREIVIAEEGLPAWNRAQVRLQCSEFSRTFRAWVDTYNPRFSYEVGSTLAHAALIPESERTEAALLRTAIRARLDALLAGGRVICFPTMPILPPHRDAPLSVMNEAGDRIVNLTAIAGLSGLPLVNLPLGQAGTIPVGIAILGARGSDLSLIEFARALGKPSS
ncbi:amidase [Kaistia dalseonensis]|uniref:Amidase n=1 Tax=Kaistia dalseonensis TaxID=410840 RepID=A0ABU0H2Z7_9HYPH|nr:amidase [Kaistia dalseonensis]MCX5494086.1 amidase [Kaistia dalseonensis]MDQ0436665.1 amidase [Kaistia dalseonensis]